MSIEEGAADHGAWARRLHSAPIGRGQALLVSSIVLAALAALPSVLCLLTVVAATLFWLTRTVRTKEPAATPLAATLVMAAVWMLVFELPLVARKQNEPALLEAVTESFDLVIDQLGAQALAIAQHVTIPVPNEARLAAFEQLSEALEHESGPASTAVLVDPDGEEVAWVGEGLRHELPDGRALPVDGPGFARSLTAVSLFAVTPLEPRARPWRVVVGESYSTLTPPFVGKWLGVRRTASTSPSSKSTRRLPLWTLRTANANQEGLDSEITGWIDLAAPHRPTLRVRSDLLTESAGGWSIWLWWLLTFGIGVTGLAYGLRAFEHEEGERVWRGVLLFSLVSLLGLGWVLDASFDSLAMLLAGGGALWLALLLRRQVTEAWRAVWIGLVVALSLLAVNALARGWPAGGLGLEGLGASFWLDADGWLQRLGHWCLVCSPFLIRGRQRGGERWFWLSLLMLGAAGAMRSQPWLAGALLAVAVVLLSRWELRRSQAGSYAALATATALISATLCAVAVEWQVRSIVQATLMDERDASLAAPLRGFFEEFELQQLALGDPDRLAERQDVAMALWRASPLSDFEGSSRVRVVPGDGEASVFFLGLPIEAGRVGLGGQSSWPVRGGSDELPGLRTGRAALLAGGRFWGEVEYSWRGLALETKPAVGSADLARSLLQRGAAETPAASLGPRAPRFAIRAADTARESGMPLDQWVLDPDSRSWQLATAATGQEGAELVRVGWYPVAQPLPALRAVGLHAVALVLALLAASALALPLAVTVPTLRKRLRWFLSSYSKKLVVLCILLLIVPVALLNLVLFQSVGDRLTEEQSANGEAALRAAVRLVEDYLPTLTPGLAFSTEFDNEFMTWLSEVVSHEVNLYWQGKVIASSRSELFDAGLLPKRIPGDVFSRLALAGEEVASRINRAGTGPGYLELYGPVALPQEDSGFARLFLSVPMLAQQEEAARGVTQLAQQTLIVTAFLLAMLVMVGSRLAASFAAPLTELRQGMKRIAGGSRSLGFEPSEPELKALAIAIDDMAERVADGRERLIRDKQVIEGVVANINSAVISIGRDARVQMCNSLARELLGVEVDQPIADLADAEIAAPLSELIRAQPQAISRRTVQLPGPDGEAEHEWTVVWVPVSGTGDPAALLVVEDITEILRGQRLEAWAEMARMIAHEVKNPLTPIRLSAEHLRRVYRTAPDRLHEVFDQCVANILDQVAELRDTVAEFSAFSRIPNADLVSGDLRAAVGRVVDGYRTSPPEGMAITLELGAAPIKARFDERLIGRAIRNLLENAIYAGSEEGEVNVELSAHGQKASVTVSDRGPGVEPEDLAKIFEPSFSTSSGGTGLGLAITRRIAEQHGGTISAHNRDGGGLRVVLALPIESASQA